MQIASIGQETKKDSPLMDINGLPETFFNYFEWTKQAICSGIQLNMFFTASSVKMAKVICGRCQVKNECLIWALMYKEEGVWGGTTDNERKKLYPQYDIEALIERANRLGVYFPKQSAQEVRDRLKAG